MVRQFVGLCLLALVFGTSIAAAAEYPFSEVYLLEKTTHAYLDMASSNDEYPSELYTSDDVFVWYHPFFYNAARNVVGTGYVSGFSSENYNPFQAARSEHRAETIGIAGGGHLYLETRRHDLDMTAKYSFAAETLADLEYDALIQLDGWLDAVVDPTGENSFFKIEAWIDGELMPLTRDGDQVSGQQFLAAGSHLFKLVYTAYAELDTVPAAPEGSEWVGTDFILDFTATEIPDPATGSALLLITGVLTLPFRRR